MKFEIVRNRKWYFLLSGTITLAGIIVMLVFGFTKGTPLNLGTDFVAGTRVQVDLNQTFQESQVLQTFNNLGYKVAAGDITTAGTDRHTAVIRLREAISADQEAKIDDTLKKQFPQEKGTQVDTVSPIVAQELSKNAFFAVLLASLGIVIYVAIRFEYRFGVSGIIALLHDAFIVISVFALLRLEVDIPFIAAVLTIVGYSINDTIVIFDRIRENLKTAKVKTLSELETLVNNSLWQTMQRSINTVLTVIFADAMLYFFGGTSIHNFTFALLVGLVSGAYSSIFIASPIWVVWRSKSLKKQS